MKPAVLLAAAALALFGTGAPAWAADDSSPAQEAAAPESNCLACHGSPGFEKKLSSNEILSLTIDKTLFDKSVHAAVGCQGCHSDVDLNAHPPADKQIAGKRAFSVAMVEVCRGCHSDKFEQWEGSIHASLVRDGNTGAPVCTDCHKPHAVIQGAAESFETVPCRTCHAPILKAYAGSVHGQALQGGNTGAPICSSCHTAHQVKAASLAMSNGLDIACVNCHTNVLDAHEKWLPNTELHFDVVSCPACHSPGAQRRVDLRLYDSATQTSITEERGIPVLAGHAGDSQGKGLDALALWKVLQTLNRGGVQGKTVLRGRLEVANGPQAHQLARKEQAISDCRTCHSKGSDAFQSVTISIVGPDGRPRRYGADKDVLSSVISLDSVGGFYAIGATRITFLDILFLLALVAGIVIPVGHGSVRWLAKRYLKQNPTSPAA